MPKSLFLSEKLRLLSDDELTELYIKMAHSVDNLWYAPDIDLVEGAVLNDLWYVKRTRQFYWMEGAN